LNKVQKAVQKATGVEYKTFKALSFKKQVVAGVNFFIKVQADDQFLHVRAHQGFTPEDVSFSAVEQGHTADDEIEYFTKNKVEVTRNLLPTDVVPLHYDLSLVPDLKNYTFDGTVVINVKVKKEGLKQFTVHSNDIKISSVVFGESNKGTCAFNEKDTTVTFTFDSALPAGDGKVTIVYQGQLNDKMAGFYRSKYVLNGEERVAATTQFEPTDARRAFPCWDEPEHKATFSVTLTVDKKLVALSNMPIVSETAKDEKKVVKFDNTPIMSTYLLAFFVGETECVEGKTREGVTVRVYTPVGKTEQGKFALDVGTKTLSYFTEYFGIPYPLPKLDMIAIADFSAGAMENWGLVTYRETALLIDEKNSTLSGKQRVAYVVAHELAHQWFGNLVTMEWWNNLWLNEGFATWVGNLAVDHLFPSWNIWTGFVTEYFARALSLDGLEHSHPVEVDVANSGQINEIFDAISYCKGASVIRMIAEFLGEADFKKGLHAYLSKHSYKNTVTEDLWTALGTASGKPVALNMNCWTKHIGYPYIKVSRTTDNQLNITQHRFVASGKTLASSP